MVPTDLRYHKEHEWVRVQGNRATLGISHFAQDALGDIVFIEMPKVGATVKAGQEIGEVESTKTTSTIYTPVSGKIVQINDELIKHPELVNTDPYGKGWMAIIELSHPSEVEGLMTAQQYQSFLASQKT
jgi:glycine cleavage system H protein